MIIRMENLERLTLADMEKFLTSHQRLHWPAPERGSVYALIERVLKAHQYARLSKKDKGVVRRFVAKLTHLSRAQLTRWIQRWRKTRRVKRKPAQRPKFHSRYTRGDAALLAEMDTVHQDLSGPAVRHLCRRAWTVFGDQRFERLAQISSSHIYNLRKSEAYRKIRVRLVHTQARQVSIGSAASRTPKGSPAICAWTPYTRASTTASQACTTSMRSTP